MEKGDLLRPGENVEVSIYGPDGECLYKGTNDTYHTLEMAVDDSISKSGIDINPEDCVFEVSNLSTGVSHRYRLNAHGHLKLII